MRCGDDTFVAKAGDYVSLRKRVPHALSNVGEQEAVLLRHTMPAPFSRSSAASAFPVSSRSQIPHRLTTRP